MFDLNCRPLATYAHIARSFVRVYSDKKSVFHIGICDNIYLSSAKCSGYSIYRSVFYVLNMVKY